MYDKKVKSLLVFNSAYTYKEIKERGLEIFITARDAGEFYDKVVTVNPFASLQYSESDYQKFGTPQVYELDKRNTIIEGAVSRFRGLVWFPRINFMLGQLSFIYSLVRFGKLKEVKLVRAEDPRLNGLYGLVFATLLRVPLVVGVWGNPGRLRKSTGRANTPRVFLSIKSEERFEKYILLRADLVLAQNTENLQYALDLGVPKLKTELTPLGIGIDKAHFLHASVRSNVEEFLQDHGIKSQKLIVCISRLESLKNVDQAILAVKSAKNTDLHFKLIIVGDGRDKVQLASLAEKLDLASDVIFAGNRSQNWIAGLLAKTDLGLAPLTGRALLEIGLAGVPVIAFDTDWHDEIVKNSETGFLVKNLDYLEMGQRIIQVLTDNKLRLELGRKMYFKAHEIASPDILVVNQKMIYSKLSC